MNLFLKYTLSLLTILTIISCSSDNSGDEMVSPTSQESFGNWSPDFTNQTTNFTQTRTGSQGNQQTRSIVVTSSTSTSSSTEEILEEDINDDGDIFEDIEVLVTTFTGSENLGSHQVTSYNVSEDNDLGFKVGNNFFSLNDGVMENYGYLEYELLCSNDSDNIRLNCDDKGIYNIDLTLFSEGLNYTLDGDYGFSFSGEGQKFYFELWMESPNSLIGGQYDDRLTRTNKTFNTNFTITDDDLFNQLDTFDDENFGCGGQYELGSESFSECDAFNFYNKLSTLSYFDIDGSYDSETDNEIQMTTLDISVDSDNIYTIKLKGGVNKLNLPVTLFYKGYLGYTEVDYDSSSEKSTSSKKKKFKLVY